LLTLHVSEPIVLDRIMPKESLILTNDVRQVSLLGDFVKSTAAKWHLSASLAGQLRLAMEEAVVNVMEYAYPDGVQGTIEIELFKDGQCISVVISDEGTVFDPTHVMSADTTLTAEDRPIGGLGISLVRKLVDEMSYERLRNKNILTLKKKL